MITQYYNYIFWRFNDSQTRLSKYMNGTTRVRGWTSLEERLILFFDEFYAYNAEEHEQEEDLSSLEASLSLESPNCSKDVSCDSPHVAESDEEPDPWSHFSISMVVDQFSRWADYRHPFLATKSSIHLYILKYWRRGGKSIRPRCQYWYLLYFNVKRSAE